ncbi:MAG: preprotein translocase subunit SecE [Candidatus Infernicultor aquiphilus]|jgi:preprotein translocase subunit SecE|uniref:Protein translocase subunit SecE n=1 Tax=Candidatus Infernicultor aquiphilus TaxID=1805029 RepID=A0A1J5GPU4_9BACT|nr:preprotein translocase subunit SecE [Candidatus Atribacteria bacterium]NCO24066.1 preprotein translocase subunit SecE [bacterium]OIP74276.1 MAG: preprotein translocase subunit SecE [Candidatus Atribacteria bacterium CG2_30_33_13]PIU24785.1 MAG: preprotein translocase subunit SecE [Candidatus Atribacteria bacterium CG08_land_8_20_14_0_20_33_29]PIW11818.1 MAG: preprotein translocase subunit SecE [Candidatus Atribacteria bacterium CG17_big_fil_post_rev_8_21_14_2_50_34_11]PIX33535.1 MAG: prepro
MKSKKFFNKIINFIKEAIAELKKVIWPSRKELKNSTIVVVFTIIIASVFIGLIDLVFTKILTLFMK